MGGMTRLLLLLWVGVAGSSVVDLQKRIFGGKKCDDHERLYHVKLITSINDKRYMCGGSLISDQWILTAAHCWEPGRNVTAVLGVHPGMLTKRKSVKIKKDPVIFKDKDVNNNDRTHDIMLLQLPKATQIKPVKLPDCGKPPKKGDEVQVAGHTTTRTKPGDKKISDKVADLQCANIKVVDCPWVSNPATKPHDYRICGQSPGVDTCPGDSGGGVVYKGMIYGVHSSSGKNLCTFEAQFMDVCKYKQWIENNTGTDKTVMAG